MRPLLVVIREWRDSAKTRLHWHGHLGEPVERLAFRQNGSLGSANLGIRLGFIFVRRGRKRGVEYHTFRPFVSRMDPDIDLLMRRAEPVHGEERGEKKASDPPEILE
jgi:hypothetical protein